ncbi:MAG TPA: hypothetical protein VIE36_07025 [Methylomirabilota bacterium]
MRTMGAMFLIAVAAVLTACASAQLAPPAVNVSGNWAGTWSYESVQMGSGDLRGTFEQNGQNVSGTFNVTGPVLNRVAIISGAVSGNEILLGRPSSGRLTVEGNKITGTINGLNVAKVSLTKQ